MAITRQANGASIGTIRRALGIKQRALAAQVGVTAPYMSQIENGVRQPPLDTIARIAAELGVTVESISYPVTEPDAEQVPA